MIAEHKTQGLDLKLHLFLLSYLSPTPYWLSVHPLNYTLRFLIYIYIFFFSPKHCPLSNPSHQTLPLPFARKNFRNVRSSDPVCFFVYLFVWGLSTLCIPASLFPVKSSVTPPQSFFRFKKPRKLRGKGVAFGICDEVWGGTLWLGTV